MYISGSSLRELPLLLFSVHTAHVPHQERNTPQACQTDEGVYDPAEQTCLTAKEPGDQVESENAHQAPVQTTDDGQNQCQRIHLCSSISEFGCGFRLPGTGGIMHFSEKFRTRLQRAGISVIIW